MRHCIASYAGKALAGESFLFHIEHRGEVASVEVDTRGRVLQAYGPEEIPFLCLAGVREYHEHPAHSGDIWELHRASGAGRLVRLLEIIHRYGIEPITGMSVQLVPQFSVNYGPPPP